MDYLLLDRPIIFYPYDYAKYVKRDRELQFDYDRMTPGPKCLNQGELERELARYLASGEDPYREEREKLLTMAFKYRDGDASKRIWEYIKNNRINSVRRRRRFMI
jgi:CDP-glycerol glycerophosphotransferase